MEPDWLLDAYRHGVFPWPTGEDDPLLWWSPDPRCIMPLDGFKTSSRLRRRMRSGRFTVTFDEDFAGVIYGCATGPGREGGTWITSAIRAAYGRLHKLGHAHSVETWTVDGNERRLVGGVYGVAVGGLFAAESMFHYETDASKVALASLVQHLNERGFRLLDIQQWTAHTGSLGATEVSRDDYLDRLERVVDLDVRFERLEARG
jgi:leucyl/phenylalanyl-tRNA--protein transferase